MDINAQTEVLTTLTFKKKTKLLVDINLHGNSPKPTVNKNITLSDNTEIEVGINVNLKKVIDLLITDTLDLNYSTGVIAASEYNLINNVIFFESNLSKNTVSLEVILPSWRDYVT